MDGNPLVFISHKHADQPVAQALARFVRDRAAGNIRVHLSSSPDFEGPRLGRPLNEELRAALAAADTVLLVFTTQTQDWSYCMWECGVATDPRDEHPTTVVVLQCTDQEPAPFGDQVRVDVAKDESVQAFVRSLLTTTDLFPQRETPLTGFSPEGPEVADFATELRSALLAALPQDLRPARRRPTCPYLRIHLPPDTAQALAEAPAAAAEAHEMVRAGAEIVDHLRAEVTLGMDLQHGTTLGQVLDNWLDGHPDEEPWWFRSLTEQIQAAVAGKLRPAKWAAYRTETGRSDVPFVSSRRIVATGVELDVYLIPFSPRPIPVADRMITREKMFVQDTADAPPSDTLLVDLVREMNERGVTRLPILTDGRATAIVHISTINQFLVTSLDGGRTKELTLQDLLLDCPYVEGAFVEVPAQATIEEATRAMEERRTCQDVYVTEDGTVVGWLPNVLLIPE